MRTFHHFKYITGFVLAIFFSSLAHAQINWQPYLTSVSFKIKNFGMYVDGSFNDFKGQLFFDPTELSSSVLSGSVEAATVNTGNSTRDGHLKRDDYFDVEKYKLIEIHSKSLYKKDNAFSGLFNITIKGITKQEEIPFSFTNNGNTAKFEGSFTINRRDFKVGDYSLILSDNVTVSIVINAKK